MVIEGIPLFDDRTDGMASVAAYTYGDHSVVFVGTRSGHLKKVRNNQSADFYRDIVTTWAFGVFLVLVDWEYSYGWSC